MKKVIVFRDQLLLPSETFIQGQVDSLREYTPIYAGLRPAVPSLAIRLGVLMTGSGGLAGKVSAFAYRSTSIAPRFHAALKAQHAALIHAHFAVDGAAALRMRKLLSIPLVVTLHGYDITWEDSAFKATIAGRRYLHARPKLFAEATLFLCVSQSIRDKAMARGFPAEKLIVHYTGIDCDQFSPLLGGARDPNLVLFVGRLVDMKGCEFAIRAMALVKQPGAKLVIIGDGPLRPALESLARELGIHVSFLGAQPADGVRKWLAKARLFCAPSVTTVKGQREGLGMVFLEAQAMGTPVVSSRSGGIPEAVAEGETGLLAPERDVPALAAHISRFLEDQAFWESCALEGRKRVLAKFDIHKQAIKLERLYDQACETSRGTDIAFKSPA